MTTRKRGVFTTRILFHDECPRIGSGLRTVTVKLGNKWVYLTDCAGRRVRIDYTKLGTILPKWSEQCPAN